MVSIVTWTGNQSRPSPSGASLRSAALTDSPYHVAPEGADGDRMPTLTSGSRIINKKLSGRRGIITLMPIILSGNGGEILS